MLKKVSLGVLCVLVLMIGCGIVLAVVGESDTSSRADLPTLSPRPTQRVSTLSPRPTQRVSTLSPRPTQRVSTLSPRPTQRVSSLPTRTRPSVNVDAIVSANIQLEPEVLDAAVSRQGSEVSLVLIVRSSTNQARGKQLGENFLRMYKSLSDDDSPGRSIGKGKYDYLVGVYYPNETTLVQGAKVSFADRITW